MIGFIIGAFVGGLVGVSVMCLMQSAAEADRQLMEDDSDDPDG